MIVRYNSPSALAEAYVRYGAQPKYEDRSAGYKWYGGESPSQSIRLAQEGNVDLVVEAERYLSALDTVLETPRKIWDRSLAGAFCVVPDVLAGRPTPMRRQIDIGDEHAPITILYNTTSSAGISTALLQKRGVVALALVMALTRIRPVSLHQLAVMHGRDTGETVFTSQINTTPLDLATACHVLTSAGFARRLTYGLGEKLNGFNGSWPNQYKYNNPKPYYAGLVLRLGLDPTKTLVIEAPKLNDEMIKSPIAWINKQIAHFTQIEEETNA